jgi:hypothetical protein
MRAWSQRSFRRLQRGGQHVRHRPRLRPAGAVRVGPRPLTKLPERKLVQANVGHRRHRNGSQWLRCAAQGRTVGEAAGQRCEHRRPRSAGSACARKRAARSRARRATRSSNRTRRYSPGSTLAQVPVRRPAAFHAGVEKSWICAARWHRPSCPRRAALPRCSSTRAPRAGACRRTAPAGSREMLLEPAR